MHSQRGWVGLVVLLLALAIVAVLAQTLLKQYGALGGADSTKSARPGDTSRAAGQLAPAPIDTTTTPAPASALERARGLESAVQQQAQELGKRIDDASK